MFTFRYHVLFPQFKLTSLIDVQAGRSHDGSRRDVRKEGRYNGELSEEGESHGGWFVGTNLEGC